LGTLGAARASHWDRCSKKSKLAYEGRFKLVKINADEEQQLAQAFGIKSMPTCVLLKNGQPVDGFMGALPEGQVKQFLDKHLPAPKANCKPKPPLKKRKSTCKPVTPTVPAPHWSKPWPPTPATTMHGLIWSSC
jgi:hypothetical protein